MFLNKYVFNNRLMNKILNYILGIIFFVTIVSLALNVYINCGDHGEWGMGACNCSDDYTGDRCSTAPPPQASPSCTRPQEAGYVFTNVVETNLELSNFSVTGIECDSVSGWSGTAIASACSASGDYNLQGCSLSPPKNCGDDFVQADCSGTDNDIAINPERIPCFGEACSDKRCCITCRNGSSSGERCQDASDQELSIEQNLPSGWRIVEFDDGGSHWENDITGRIIIASMAPPPVEPNQACTSNVDCPTGEMCSNQTCMPPPRDCVGRWPTCNRSRGYISRNYEILHYETQDGEACPHPDGVDDHNMNMTEIAENGGISACSDNISSCSEFNVTSVGTPAYCLTRQLAGQLDGVTECSMLSGGGSCEKISGTGSCIYVPEVPADHSSVCNPDHCEMIDISSSADTDYYPTNDNCSSDTECTIQGEECDTDISKCRIIERCNESIFRCDTYRGETCGTMGSESVCRIESPYCKALSDDVMATIGHHYCTEDEQQISGDSFSHPLCSGANLTYKDEYQFVRQRGDPVGTPAESGPCSGSGDGSTACVINDCCRRSDGSSIQEGTCPINHHVANGECVPCERGFIRSAGDSPSSGDTLCDELEICGPGQFAQDRPSDWSTICESCPLGTELPEWALYGNMPISTYSILLSDRYAGSEVDVETQLQNTATVDYLTDKLNNMDEPTLGALTHTLGRNPDPRDIAQQWTNTVDESAPRLGSSSVSHYHPCIPIICNTDEYSVDHVCTPCPSQLFRNAGDDSSTSTGDATPRSVDTTCLPECPMVLSLTGDQVVFHSGNAFSEWTDLDTCVCPTTFTAPSGTYGTILVTSSDGQHSRCRAGTDTKQ